MTEPLDARVKRLCLDFTKASNTLAGDEDFVCSKLTEVLKRGFNVYVLSRFFAADPPRQSSTATAATRRLAW